MNKKEIIVPAGIRYISEWKNYNFNMTSSKCIINKQITGCGFTEYYLTNNENVIVASPRIMLLRNKYEQHHRVNELDRIFLSINCFDRDPDVDKGIQNKGIGSGLTENEILMLNESPEQKASRETNEYNIIYQDLYDKLLDYIQNMKKLGLPYKILVTYDSYHVIKDILKFVGIFDSFTTMVDEVQVVLDDSRFKAETELKLMKSLEDVSKVHFVSATPMLDKYIELLDGFRDLDYYTINWVAEDPTRVIKPKLDILTMRSVNEAAGNIIQSYLDGNFKYVYEKQNDGIIKSIVSKEAVFYVNSVNHIISVIKKTGLKPDQVNILCSDTSDNRKKIKKKLGRNFNIGYIPEKGETHKMFTFCTRTVYLGADFYSTNARSFIFSDSNVDCLSIDISIDLPQIMGRQRLSENPWKNSATFYYKTTADYRKMSKFDFEALIKDKEDVSNSLLSVYNKIKHIEPERRAIVNNYKKQAKFDHYKDNYVSVNDNVPVFNNYAYVSEIRAFDIQQVDYKDRFSIFNEFNKRSEDFNIEDVDKLAVLLGEYSKLTVLSTKLKFICDIGDLQLAKLFLYQLQNSDYAKQYYLAAGRDVCISLNYNIDRVKNYISKILIVNENNVRDKVISEFNVGDRLSYTNIKQRLERIYNELGYGASPKATDLSKWFEVKSIRLSPVSKGSKRDAGYEILKIR